MPEVMKQDIVVRFDIDEIRAIYHATGRLSAGDFVGGDEAVYDANGRVYEMAAKILGAEH